MTKKFKIGDYVFRHPWFKKRMDYVKWQIIEIGKPSNQFFDEKGRPLINIKIKQITETYHDGSKWTDEPWIRNSFDDELMPYNEKLAKKLWDEAIERGHR